MESKAPTKKKTSVWKWILYLFLGALVLSWTMSGIQSLINMTKSPEEKAAKAREDSLRQIEFVNNQAEDALYKAQEDTLLRAYHAAESLLKQSLRDPNSYEEISHKQYFVKAGKKKKNPYVQVVIDYRARNGFGGMNVDRKIFDFNKSMGLAKVSE